MNHAAYTSKTELLMRELRKQIDYWVGRGICGASAQSLVLQHGRSYPGAPLPKALRRRCAERRCFHNAIMLVLDHEDHVLRRDPALDATRPETPLAYVEGFAVCGESRLPVHHAWVTGTDARAFDPTWGYRADAVYFGVPIATRCLRSAIRSGYTRNLMGFPGQFDPDLHALPVSEWVSADQTGR
jgi:hypothetical protein